MRGQSSVWRLPKYWPPTPLPPGECVPPSLWCRGRTHSLGGEGVGGQHFRRRQTLLCYICKYFVLEPSRAASASCCISVSLALSCCKMIRRPSTAASCWRSSLQTLSNCQLLETVSEINHNSPAARNWFTNHRQLPAAWNRVVSHPQLLAASCLPAIRRWILCVQYSIA